MTLDQTTATNYFLSNGTVAWDAALAGSWKNNIAGIARDDTSTLSQLSSQSVTSTGDLIVSTSSIGTNRMSLLWANDNAQVGTFTGTDAPSGLQRVSREWFFEEKNGDLGIVTLSYPNAAVATGFTAPLILLMDTDSTFAVGATAYTGTYNTGANSWDFSVNIADQQYLTFAKNVSTDTTAPIISNPNIASGTLIPTGNFSYQFSYADTGSAINTSSVTMNIYSWNTGSSTWNSTNLAPTYMSTTSISSSTGVFQLSNLPYGKYRFDMIVADTVGNTLTQSTTLFVDAIEWIVSSPIYDIGGVQTSILGIGTGELLITVKTVGAGFDLSMFRSQDLILGSGSITVWNGANGW